MEEYCPMCNGYTYFELNDIDENGHIRCSHCGENIYACSACERHDCCSENKCFWNEHWARKYGIMEA